MPIWSLTVERLAKLKAQIAAKKAEHDELDALSEKDPQLTADFADTQVSCILISLLFVIADLCV